MRSAGFGILDDSVFLLCPGLNFPGLNDVRLISPIRKENTDGETIVARQDIAHHCGPAGGSHSDLLTDSLDPSGAGT